MKRVGLVLLMLVSVAAYAVDYPTSATEYPVSGSSEAAAVEVWETLYDKDFTNCATDTGIGNTEGAKTICGDVGWTLNNDSGSYLAGSGNGLKVVNGSGLVMTANGTGGAVGDWHPATELGPYIWVTLETLLGDTWDDDVYAADNYPVIGVRVITDMSDADVTGERLYCGLLTAGGSGFLYGGTTFIGYSGSAQQVGYRWQNAAPVTGLSGLSGIGATGPITEMVALYSQATAIQAWFGETTNTTPSTSLYTFTGPFTRGQNESGGLFDTTTALACGIEDSGNDGLAAVIKRIQLVTIADAYRAPGVASDAISTN